MGVHHLVPGLTGWAQINGRDELSLLQKAKLDAEYLRNQSVMLDIRILIKTVVKILLKKEVSH